MDKRSLTRVALLLFVAAAVAALGLSAMRDRAGGGAAGTADHGAAAQQDGARAGGPAAEADAAAGRQVAAYYFHRTMRCSTCRSIESQAFATIARDFAVEIDQGVLTWQAVNVDEPQFEHFVDEYDLTSSALVLVELQDGRAVRWSALEEVWNLVGDGEQFARYVSRQVRAYLESGAS